MTTSENFQALIQKYQNGECSQQERQELENWYNAKAKDNPRNGDSPDEIYRDHEDSLWQIIYTEPEQKRARRVNWSLNMLLIAATITIVGIFSTLFFKRTDTAPAQYANDINPGGNKAILTLQNGKKIQLSDTKEGIVVDGTKLSYNDGTLINTEQAQTFTVSTPRGGAYQVGLPDGSKVWLNAASSLTYTPALKGQEQTRNIKLSGEAYFEVTKDKKHPFVVTTDKQRIEVLGTHFNISAYIDDTSVKTTLLEGSIKVAILATNGSVKETILKPGQQSELRGNGISVREITDPTDAIAWKNGEFIFKDERLENIMQKIARWYDVEVVYTDKQLGNRKYSGFVSRYGKVSEMLSLLEAMGDVKFKIEGRRILVKP